MNLRRQTSSLQYFPPTRAYTRTSGNLTKRKCLSSDDDTSAIVPRTKRAKIVPKMETEHLIAYRNVYFLKSRPELLISKVTTVAQDQLQVDTISPHGKYLQLTVEENDYVRPCASLDKYSSSDITTEKLKRNLEFLDLLRAYHQPQSDHEIVLLDSPSIVTTNFLVASELFSSDQIHVPNLQEDFNSNAPKSFTKKATSYHSSIYEFLRDLPSDDQVQYHFGGDYCCTFEGNQWIKPKSDLLLLFSRSLFPRRNGVMWLTFSMRRKNTETQEVVNYVHEVSRRFGYTLTWLNREKCVYSNMMYFFFVST